MRQEIADLILSCGGTHKLDGRHSTIRMPAKRWVQALKSGAVRAALSSKNQFCFDEACMSDRPQSNAFAGGSPSDLFERFEHGADISEHQKKLTQFERGDMGRKLRASVEGLASRRKMRLSDSDGDWEYSRRFDEKPFVQSYKPRTLTKVIEIEAGFSFSSGVSSESINLYGAFLWALIRLIESNGIMTRLVYTGSGRNIDVNRSLDYKTELIVKEPGEYLAPALLAATLSSLFYRRAEFAAIVTTADLHDKETSFGLGQPIPAPPIRFENGRLITSGDAHKGATDDVINQITKAFA